MSEEKKTQPFSRVTGLLIIEARMSNPNGDPDQESDPRTLSVGDRGLISPVSLKRKLRDLVLRKDAPVWEAAKKKLQLADDEHDILESRGRNRDEIWAMQADAFNKRYWDARLFGNTFLESMTNDTVSGSKDHFISTGVVQFGVGISISPVQIERMTTTNMAGVEGGKDRGMLRRKLSWP